MVVLFFAILIGNYALGYQDGKDAGPSDYEVVCNYMGGTVYGEYEDRICIQGGNGLTIDEDRL